MIPRKFNPITDVEMLKCHFLIDIKDDDRRLRFGALLSDQIILGYIENSLRSYGHKNMWFVIEEGERIVASCHVAYDGGSNTAELGLTVSPDYRNQKIGQLLYNRGALWARKCGADTVYMHCLSENQKMQHIARKNGMTVITLDPSEKEATVKITKSQGLAMFEDTIVDNIAIYDSTFRKQRWFFEKMVNLFQPA